MCFCFLALLRVSVIEPFGQPSFLDCSLKLEHVQTFWIDWMDGCTLWQGPGSADQAARSRDKIHELQVSAFCSLKKQPTAKILLCACCFCRDITVCVLPVWFQFPVTSFCFIVFFPLCDLAFRLSVALLYFCFPSCRKVQPFFSNPPDFKAFQEKRTDSSHLFPGAHYTCLPIFVLSCTKQN